MRFIAILISALSITPCTAQSYIDLCQMGEKSFEKKEYRQSAEYFTRANKAARSKNEQLHTLINTGYAWKMAGDNMKAAENYEKAIAIDSTQLGLYLQLGNALLEIDSTKAAIKCYDKIIDALPNNRDVLFFRAYAYTKENLFKEAKKDYIKLLAINPDDNDARLGLAMLYQKEGSINECQMLLETLIEEQPENSEYYFARCNLEYEQKQYELALSDVDKAIELAPENAEYHLTRVEILKKLGKNNAAHKSTAEAQKLRKEIK